MEPHVEFMSSQNGASDLQSYCTTLIGSVATNTHFQVFKYFGKYLVSDEYLNTI